MKWLILTSLLLHILLIVSCQKGSKKRQRKGMKAIVLPKYRYPNPGLLKDRQKSSLKPVWPDPAVLNKPREFHPAWMDYCDPYHCNDYWNMACGLNRRKMKFKWFQSQCHLILNNRCSTYRGFMKYQPVETKYCMAYAMIPLRTGCPSSCPAEEKPVCAVNMDTNKLGVFKNKCQMHAKNCRAKMQKYVEISANICLRDIDLVMDALDAITDQELKKGNYSSEVVDGTGLRKYYIE